MLGVRPATRIASLVFHTVPMWAISVGTSGKPLAISSMPSGAQKASSSALNSTSWPSSRHASKTGSSRPWSHTW